MTNQEAIETLRSKVDIINEYISEDVDRTIKVTIWYLDALKLGIEALEKQIAKRPNVEGDGYDEKGNMIYDIWVCPNCETHYEIEYDDYEYCPKCGQKMRRIERDE